MATYSLNEIKRQLKRTKWINKEMATQLIKENEKLAKAVEKLEGVVEELRQDS